MKRQQFIKETAALGAGLGLGNAAVAQVAKTNSGGPPTESIAKGPTPDMSGRMQAEWRWALSPYTLATGIHLFSDWRYIDPGTWTGGSRTAHPRSADYRRARKKQIPAIYQFTCSGPSLSALWLLPLSPGRLRLNL